MCVCVVVLAVASGWPVYGMGWDGMCAIGSKPEGERNNTDTVEGSATTSVLVLDSLETGNSTRTGIGCTNPGSCTCSKYKMD